MTASSARAAELAPAKLHSARASPARFAFPSFAPPIGASVTGHGRVQGHHCETTADVHPQRMNKAATPPVYRAKSRPSMVGETGFETCDPLVPKGGMADRDCLPCGAWTATRA